MRFRFVFAPVLAASAMALYGCGGGDDGGSLTGAGAGAAAGAVGVGGGDAGGGHATGGTSSSQGGSGGNHAGGMGVAGAGGSAPAGGHAGSAGAGGSSGPGGKGGGGGAAGSGGGVAGCKLDSDCVVPMTAPPNCAVAKCDPTSHACSLSAKDADKDGYTSSVCKAADGTSILLGDDCDDTNPAVHPKAWDGPKADGNPDRCDGVDEDCNGLVDDGKAANGASCTCTPGDIQKCSTDAGGQPITFPALDASGNPLGKYCKIGKSTCGADGKWGTCVGAVGPLPADLCDGLDENCNGKVDVADTVPPVGQITYTFDGDLDNHAQSGTPLAKRSGCPGAPPTTCPTYFTGTCDPAVQWRTGSFPLDDCDDNDPNAFPGSPEKCNGVDDDCNGKKDDNAIDASSWVFDWDGDGYGDINVKAVKSCTAPTTLPAACTDGLAAVPAGYCTGLPPEGNAPKCPPPACDVSMWVTGIPATDCKDNPGEGGATEGNKPDLVHPGGSDLCNGLDYACQGTPDIGCGCSPLGSTKTCGDAQTCNAGTATCNGGGTWGSCDGGDPQQRLDYCMDFDGDGACNLANCLSAACPSEAPSAAGWKPKNNCAPSSDCNDMDNGVIPGLPETCNGDGVDHNCNGVVNTPGAGDCDCNSLGPNKQTLIDCKPPVGYYPPTATPGDPSTGMGGHVVGSTLAGVCKWGTSQCDSTGHLTSCSGAAPGQPTEQCTGDGKDYNCNGVLNTAKPGDCGCNNGDVQSCGTCLLGSQTCGNGAWGPCSGDPGYATYCPDNDTDGYCVLSGCSVSKCPNDPLVTMGKLKTPAVCGSQTDCNDSIATAHPGAPELCGDGINENCDAGNLDSDGYTYMSVAVGGACTNGQVGSCNKPGTVVCGANGTSNPAICNAGDWSDKATWFNKTTTVPVHGSFDTNCSGKTDVQSIGAFGPTASPAIVDATCSNVTGHYCNECVSKRATTTNDIFNFIVVCHPVTFDQSIYTAASTMVANSGFGGQVVNQCGQQLVIVQCNIANDGSCLAAGGQLFTEQCE